MNDDQSEILTICVNSKPACGTKTLSTKTNIMYPTYAAASRPFRHDVGGEHTCLSRRIPGFESPWRKIFDLPLSPIVLLSFCIFFVDSLAQQFCCHSVFASFVCLSVCVCVPGSFQTFFLA